MNIEETAKETKEFKRKGAPRISEIFFASFAFSLRIADFLSHQESLI